MGVPANKNSFDYRVGYNHGFKEGKRSALLGKRYIAQGYPKAYWFVKNGNWYCSGCGTKYEQAHNDFCCKCGCKMSEEALLDEDNEICVTSI